NMIITHVVNHPKITLGLATGGTPKGTYRRMIDDHRENGTSYKEVSTVNLDEYIGIAGENPNSYRHYMDEHLFSYLDIFADHIHIPDGIADDMNEECRRYDSLIASLGGIDL